METCGNTSYAYGGGMRIDCDSSSKLYVTVEHCIFKNNRSYDISGPNIGGRSASGGAIWIYGRRNPITAVPATYAQAHINNCDFTENYAQQISNGGHGGAVLLRDLDTASVTNSSFCDNYVYSTNADNGDLQHDRNAGGAICVYDLKNTSPGNKYHIDGCTFINNSATVANNTLTFPSEGGAVFLTKGDILSATTTAVLHISNSDFYNNNVQTGIEHIDNNSGTIDTANIGFNGFYNQFQVGLGDDTTLCEGDSMTLDASIVGATYLWENGTTSATRTVTDSGEYSVTVTVGSCEVSDTIIIDVVPIPDIDLGADTIICGYDSNLLDAYWPNSTYTWSNLAVDSAIWAGPGTYWVEVDASGCVDKDTIVIDSVSLSEVDLGPDTTLCGVSSYTMNVAQSGASYLWQNGSTSSTLIANTAGVYSVTVSNQACSYDDDITINFESFPIVNLLDSQTICPYDNAVLDATTANAQYLWNTGSTNAVLNTSQEGLYIVAVDVNSCVTYDTAYVDTIEIPPSFLGPDLLLCPGQSYAFDASTTGAAYLWHNGQTGATFSGSLAGQYWVQVSKENCVVSDSITIQFVTPPSDLIGDDINVCEDQTVILTVYPNGLNNFIWSTGSNAQEITVTTPGQYRVTASKSGCPFSDSVEVTHRPLPKIDLGGDREVCDGETVVLDVSNLGGSYHWANGSNKSVRKIKTTGTYSVTVNVDECLSSETVFIRFKPNPTPNLKEDITKCAGRPHTFDAFRASFDGYLWQNGSVESTITVTKVDTVWVRVSMDGCYGYDTVLFNHTEKPELDLGADTIICGEGELELDAKVTGNAYYEWHDKSTAPTFLVWRSGTYHVTVRREGCTAKDSIRVEYKPYPKIELGNDTLMCIGDSIRFFSDDSLSTFIWNGEIESHSYSINDSGTVTVVGDGYCGSIHDTVYVSVRDCDCYMYIPNTFSPDGDDINDEFLTQFDCDLSDFSMVIRDRWGRIVFESTNPSEAWDGTKTGYPVEIGAYVYELRYNARLRHSESKVHYQKSGVLNVLR
ncbi:MAG: hypothetical protein Salg2KO_18060 [Salibacteraceae bacterium]